MKKKININYWLRLAAFSIVPTILTHLALTPLWQNKKFDHTIIATIEGIITIIVLPIYLVIAHIYLNKKNHIKLKMFFINIIMVYFCIWFSGYLGFLNWAYSIGDIISPDNDTIEVIGFERSLGYIFSTIGLIIAFFILKKSDKAKA